MDHIIWTIDYSFHELTHFVKLLIEIFDNVTSVPKSQGLVFFVENCLINQLLINIESYRIITVPS